MILKAPLLRIPRAISQFKFADNKPGCQLLKLQPTVRPDLLAVEWSLCRIKIYDASYLGWPAAVLKLLFFLKDQFGEWLTHRHCKFDHVIHMKFAHFANYEQGPRDIA